MLLVEYLAFNTFLLATSCHAPPHRMDPDSFIVFLPYPENRTDPITQICQTTWRTGFD